MSGATAAPPFSGQALPGHAASGPGPFVRATPAADELVQRARQEIAEIVREVAALARQPLKRHLFFAALIDRTVCAIAAQGSVIWDLRSEEPVAVARTGAVTDLAISPEQRATHLRMLQEVALNQAPVVVPSTPDADDPLQPHNPTRFPAAVVPIADLTGACYLIEVFLEQEAGVATQRGYLRFVAQMSDLASEFLRNDEIRVGRADQQRQRQWMQALEQLHRLDTSSAVAASLVDAVADMMGAARVSLATIHFGKARLLAISHVDAIDRRGAACRQLCRVIETSSFSPSQTIAMPEPPAAEIDSPHEPSTAILIDVDLHTWATLRNESDTLRLLVQGLAAVDRDAWAEQAIDQWLQPCLSLVASRLQLESIPLAKAYLSLSPQILRMSPSRTRRVLTLSGAALVIGMIAWIPTPMMVSVPATLRPQGVRTHYSPSDVVIERIAVVHGQSVKPGEVLLQLRDWKLEEQISSLNARRAVVTQRLARSLTSLVQSPSSLAYPGDPSYLGAPGASSDEELVQQQRLLEEELAGITEQLEIFQAARERLTIRADREGTVDAWQTELTAEGRPVRRGDALIRVEPIDAPWMVDARVPQSRAGLVTSQLAEFPETRIKVATVARPDQTIEATFTRLSEIINPASTTAERLSMRAGESSLGLELVIAGKSIAGDIASQWVNGAPATAVIDCGKKPLVQVVFFDLVRAVRRSLARWI